MNNDKLDVPITIVSNTEGISGNIIHDTLYLTINWNDFDHKYIKRDEIISNNTSSFFLTADWGNNISKIDKFTLIKEIKDEILMELQFKLDMKENEPDNVKEAWQDVKDAVMAYMIAQKLAS